MLYFNNQTINNLFFNNQEMNYLYFNNTLVWQKILELNSYLSSFTLPNTLTNLSFTSTGSGSLISYNGENTYLSNLTANVKLISNATRLFLNSNCANFFTSCRNLTSDMLNNVPFDYSLIKDGNNMFSGCLNLTSLPESTSFDNLTTAYKMFSSCINLTSLPESTSFDNLTNGDYMFYACDRLRTLPDTISFNNLVNVYSLFAGCDNLITLSNNITFNKVINTSNMFSGCLNLTSLPESTSFDKLLNAYYMFPNCTNLTGNINIGYNGNAVINCERMLFNHNKNLQINIHVCKYSRWDAAIRSGTTQTNSITGYNITWTNFEDGNGYFNSTRNIYVYNNYVPQ